jgi:hypothetical protein
VYVPEDPLLSLGTGGGGDPVAFRVGFRFGGDGEGATPPLFRFPQNGILLFLPLVELEDSACRTGWGGVILLGVAGSFLGGGRVESDCPPKKSDRPEVLVFKRGAATSVAIGGATRKENNEEMSDGCGGDKQRREQGRRRRQVSFRCKHTVDQE